MFRGVELSPPIFEIGLKGHAYGAKAIELARAADRISKAYEVQIIFDPQHVDIRSIAEETDNLLVFAQHMDPVEPGRGAGAVLPEALKEAGAVGTLLNHAERRITLSEIARAIGRADEVGLLTMVCADSPEEAAAIAHLGPNMILAEPPELIGTGKPVGEAKKEFISKAKGMVNSINPGIIVFGSAGIRTADDVAEVIRLGADGTGSTSGILKAKDPVRMMEEMIMALKEAWLETP